jgi:anti-sigma regulatory factor (Ser/Thr protein kinase)
LVGQSPPRLQHERPTLRLELPARPECLPEVRRALEDLDLSEPFLEDAQLLTTELVSNSIRHAGLGPDDVIVVTITCVAATLRVTVQDGGTRSLPEHILAGSIRPSPTGRSGWGLYLVDKLATRWGTNIAGRVGFWFELEAEPAGDRAS